MNSPSDANIRDKPELLAATVTNYPAGSTGKYFKYVVEAFNAVGSTRGTVASYLLATVPQAPTLAPSVVAPLTSSTQITVLLAALSGDAQTGGSVIKSYALQMSSNSPGEAAEFVDIQGTLTDSVAL